MVTMVRNMGLALYIVLLAHSGLSQDQNQGEPEIFKRQGDRNQGEPELFERRQVLLDHMAEPSDQNQGEPALFEREPQYQNEGEPAILELYADSADFVLRGDDNDAIKVPDSVWNTETNYTQTHPGGRFHRQVGNDLTPPSQACLSIKIIFNNAWVQSSANGNVAQATTAARDVLAEAQNIYNSKYASANQLGTAVTFNLVGGAPVHDSRSDANWQATGSDLQNAAVQRHIDTASYTTQHYAFLTGSDSGGAIGIAYLGTPCLQAGQDQKYKKSINEWYNNMADSAGVMAHEIGHALGMEHDFVGSPGNVRRDRQGNSCTDINGLMDYGARRNVDKFSSCSKQDFRDFYNRMLGVYGAFCMACSTNPTTTQPPTTTVSAGTCNGNPSTDWSCCSSGKPCSVGGGDCDNDSECAGNLVCGNDNCINDFPSTGSNWHTLADCCISSTTSPTSPCSGNPSTDWACCSSTSPCDVGGGDCDTDADCKGSLKCGKDNCQNDFATSGSNWHSSADCCNVNTVKPCSGVPTTDWSCCSSTNPCDVGGGDCDTDADCKGSLKCGQNNCKNDFPNTGSNWSTGADCCIGGGAATTVAPQPTSVAPQPTTNTPSSSCGVKPAGIVGGSEVTPYSLPWQVGLVSSGGNTPWCGGTLISDRHVLTAAHCTGGSNFDIIVGEHTVTSGADGTRHEICRAVRHPNYNSPSQLNNDFSIVHLRTPVTIGTRAAPACLPTSAMAGDFLAGKTMTVSGWGRLSSGGTTPNVLHSVNVPGITNADCSKAYGGITNAMLCAGDVANGGIDSCQGDSGGPLTYTQGGRTTLVGVVSWGIGCAQAGNPGVYARVTEVLGWINGELAQTC